MCDGISKVCQEAPSDFVEMTATLSSKLRPDKKQIYEIYRNSSVILQLQNICTFFLVLSFSFMYLFIFY
jgi:hypothetical protein